MKNTFNKLPERHTAYEDIIDEFYKKIKSGDIKLNDKLPSERDLAQQFGVGRTTIREALKSMKAMGVLEVKPGQGTFVRAGDFESIKKHLQWSLYLNPSPIEELIEIRTLLESRMAEKAAIHRTEEDLKEMEKTVELMKSSIQNPQKTKKYDLLFHLTIGKASGIKLMSDILELIRYSLEDWFERVLSDYRSSKNTVEEHLLIIEAIREENSEKAKKLMEEHLEKGIERLFIESKK